MFIGIDIGTQGTKAVLTDRCGNIRAEAFCDSVLYRPDNITVYEEPENIFNSVIAVIKQIMEKSKADKDDVKSICIDSQMAGIMGIDENFEPAIVLDSWLDSRCSEYTNLIKKEVGNEAILSSGGQIIHSAGSKILWWKNEKPEAYQNVKKFVQPNGFVAGKLCGLNSDDAFMDYTFLHFNCFSDNLNKCFNKNLLKEFSIDDGKMPLIVDPKSIVGTVIPCFAEKCGLGDNVKVLAGCGDTAASSLGAGITTEGQAYDVAGTASVFACCTKEFAPDVKNHTILYSRSVCDDLFLPLSYISGGGLTLSWFSDLVQNGLKELDILADNVPIGSNDIIFIPHFSGRTFPLDNNVTGAFLGLGATSNKGSMYRSILESIAFEYKYYLDILKSSGAIDDINVVYGVGGGAKSSIFSKIKADVLGCKYVSLSNADSAPVAMALLGAKVLGYRNETLQEIFKNESEQNTVHMSDNTANKLYEEHSNRYIRLVNNYGDYFKLQNGGSI